MSTHLIAGWVTLCGIPLTEVMDTGNTLDGAVHYQLEDRIDETCPECAERLPLFQLAHAKL